MVREETPSVCGDLVSTIKDELRATFQAFRSNLREEPGPSRDPLVPQPSSEPQSGSQIIFGGPISQDASQESVSLAPDDTDSEEEENESDTASKYKLSLEEVGGLLKVIHATLGIEEEKKELSLHDRMYAGLGDSKGRSFPVHSVITDMIKKEWLEPEKKPFFSRAHKKRFPFEENPDSIWNKVPKLDSAFSQVSKSTDLAFEDMGTLKEPMDKRMDLLLKRTWQSVMHNLKPAMATTCVARNLDHWVNQLKAHVIADSSKQEILDSFSTLSAAISYIADASAESIRMSARSAALTNSARRALWLKTWPGDAASKNRLCGIPFAGDLLFGSELESILDRTADKKRSFPVKKKQVQTRKRFFRPQKGQQEGKTQGKRKSWSSQKPKGRGGVLFNPPAASAKSQ